MKIPRADHCGQDWLINRIAPDFELHDAWAIPIEGAAHERGLLYARLGVRDAGFERGSWASQALFRLRAVLGRYLDWDAELNTLPIPGCKEHSLRERVAPAQRSDDVERGTGPFRLIYRNEREFATDISNNILHAVMQIGWATDTNGHPRAQMGVYVKSRSRFGPLYMAVIRPFRELIIYPSLIKRMTRAWAAAR